MREVEAEIVAVGIVVVIVLVVPGADGAPPASSPPVAESHPVSASRSAKPSGLKVGTTAHSAHPSPHLVDLLDV